MTVNMKTSVLQRILSRSEKKTPKWENISANYKGFVSRIKNCYNSIKTNKPILKWAKDLKRQFSKDINSQ